MSDNAAEVVERPANVPAERVVDFDIYNPSSDQPELHLVWKELQDSSPFDMVWTPRNGGHWIATRGALIERILADHDRFSSYTVLVPKETLGTTYRFYPLSLDPPAHTPYRAVMNTNLTPKAVNRIERQVRDLAIELIEGFRERGQCNFAHDFAEQMPLRMFMDLVKLPVADLPRLKHLTDMFTRPGGDMALPDVTAALQDYLRPVIQERRGKGLDDLLISLFCVSINGRPVPDEEASHLAIQVLVGGLDTVVNFMAFVMLYLARNPEFRHRLASNPKLIPKAVLEFLRRFPVVADAREVRHDQDFEGVRLLKGDMILAPTVLHGLDEKQFANPLEVDLDRPLPNLTSFGKGVHLCPGQHLARLEMRVTLEEWLKRIPDFNLAPDTIISYASGINQGVAPYTLVWDAGTRREAA